MPVPAQVHTIRLITSNPLRLQIQEFLLEREARGLSRRTVEWYGEQLAHLEAYCVRMEGVKSQSQDAQDLTPTLLRGLLVDFGATHNPGGVHGLYRAVRAFLNWYTYEYDLPKNPIDKVHPPRVPEQPLEPVNLDHLRAMLATCGRRTFYGERDRALLLFLLDSGLRRAEMLTLNVGDVDMQTVSVMVHSGKGGKPRVTFTGPKTRQALTRYLRQRQNLGDATPLWTDTNGQRLKATALRAILCRRAERAGVPAPSIHSFRRGFAIASLRAGMDLVSLQRLLGHSDLSVIRRYLAQTEGDLQAAHAQASPVDRLL